MSKRTGTHSGRSLAGKTFIKIVSFGLLAVIAVVIFLVINGYIKAGESDSYLPSFSGWPAGKRIADTKKLKIENNWYSLILDEGGNISVVTPGGEEILSDLIYYRSGPASGEKWGLDSITIQTVNDSTLSLTGKSSANTTILINFIVSSQLPVLNINIKTLYNTLTVVSRESLVASFDVKPSEIYLKNSKIDNKVEDKEYWLDNQGIRFGSGERSALIYHPSSVSSLQYARKNNLVFINTEFYLDHPNINIPYQADGGGRWNDVSRAVYKPGDIRENSISLYFGRLPEVTPRLMMVPKGYLAGYIFTEHADGANMRLNRAVYFGSEKINKITDASGGFAGHHIPVTKSVFYLDSSDCSVSRDSSFIDFLDQLDSTGLYDICLHTPEDGNSNREVLKESIGFMKNRYNSETWIDHGMYNGKNNREAFVCDGLDSTSQYFAADLWKEFGTDYFWNAGPEKIRDFPMKNLIKKFRLQKFVSELWRRYLLLHDLRGSSLTETLFGDPGSSSSKYEMNSLEPFKGNSYPTPLYWQNITQTGNFYSWVTDYVKDFSNLTGPDAAKELNIEQKLLDRLVNERGVFINHGYFVRDRKGIDDGTFTESDGALEVGPWFDKMLGYMETLHEKGDLDVTTVKDLLGYLKKARNVSFEYRPDGKIFVFNRNNEILKGLSFAAKTDSVKVNGIVPEFKTAGDDLIFWFDIPAMTGMILEFN